jgi:type III secretion protein C
VATLSSVEAVFENSSIMHIPVSGNHQSDLFPVSTGTVLRVLPHVFRDRDATRIKLLVSVEDGGLASREVYKIPIVNRSIINTQALIAEGESLLLGGMVRESSSSTHDKVPGLGNLPVVGRLFRTEHSTSTRVERMVLLTPRLAGTRPAAPSASEREHSAATAPSAFTPPRRAPVEIDLNAPVTGAPQPAAPPAPRVPLPYMREQPAAPVRVTVNH